MEPEVEASPPTLEGIVCWELECDEALPEQVTAVALTLDATARSTLCWKEARLAARSAADRGQKLILEVDLGFLGDVRPLSDLGQLKTHARALDHITESFIEPLGTAVLGVSLYQGALPGREQMVWDEKLTCAFAEWCRERGVTAQQGERFMPLFCLGALVEYAELLVPHIAEAAAPLLQFDLSHITSRALLALVGHGGRLGDFEVAFRGSSYPLPGLVWQEGEGMRGYIGRAREWQPLDLTEALLLPPLGREVEYFSELERILSSRAPMKLIDEEHLSLQWEGVNRIYCSRACLSRAAARLLMGFEAAGGEVVYFDGE